LFHALALGILVLLAFHTNLPLQPEDGVEVNFEYGNREVAKMKPDTLLLALDGEPRAEKKIAEKTTVLKTAEATHNSKKKNPDSPTASKAKISIVETPDESTLIHRSPKTGKISKISNKVNQENTGKSINEEKQVVTASPPANKKIEEKGNSITYDLGGREARILPKPAFSSSEDGQIVVSVKVNIEGKVISASAGAKGTTIADPSLRRQAENAARISYFKRDADAPEEQRGTITYVFVKQK
jgi:hypothetical protein